LLAIFAFFAWFPSYFGTATPKKYRKMKVTKAGREKKGRKRPFCTVFWFCEPKKRPLRPTFFHFHFFLRAQTNERDNEGDQAT
jgi:hypothetical protein